MRNTEGGDPPEVTVYLRPGCPFCDGLRLHLESIEVAYVARDVRADEHALAEMLRLNGGRRCVPTIVRGTEVIVGFGGYSST